MEIRPQPGPQEQFLATSADIGIFGGSAGCGKSHSLLMEPLRHVVSRDDFAAVLFRRTLADAKKPGSTWDDMVAMYGAMRARPRLDNLSWQWPGGGKVVIGHLEHESTVLDWHSAAIPLFLFEELTHFSRAQFFYMLSRNRSIHGVRPYIRAACNADADSWVAEFLAWWIDQDTGFPIRERAGVLRWFVRLGDILVWADSAEELIAQYGPESRPKSVTFVPALLRDNKILMAKDPGYLANLQALAPVERARLLDGNWKIRPSAGLYFQRSWCEMVDAAPDGLEVVRYWDLAATPKTPDNDPDWTVGLKVGRIRGTGTYFVLHAKRLRDSPMKVESTIANTASADGPAVAIGIPQDPGQAGKSQTGYLIRQLAGYTVRSERETGDKIVRFGPFSSQAEAGNVKILRGEWNSDYLNALESFPDARHDDDADASSGAFAMLTGKRGGNWTASPLRI